MRADALYTTEKGISLNGVDLFLISGAPADPTALVEPVRLYLHDRYVACANGSEAQRVIQATTVGLQAEGVYQRDLPSHYGYVTDMDGQVTHVFTASGNVLHQLTYLGRSGHLAARKPFRMPGFVSA